MSHDRLRRAVLAAAILFSLTAASAPTDSRESLAGSRYWHLLLHYRSRVLGGGFRSEADGEGFYLSPNGRQDPLAELDATVAAFSNPSLRVGPLAQHPQCAFPERFRFLTQALQLTIPAVPCPEFTEWKSRFRPRSATLVFASAYLSSPASMFGHTFLRIDSEPLERSRAKNDLLDYGVSYGADSRDSNDATLILRGLLGGFRGYFALQTYTDKVNEYSNVDSRDLWEYRLGLSPEQIDRMLNHLWELGTTYFDYYFFDKNCSYELLTILEVANPDWHLTDAFIYYVIPSDTIRVLDRYPGAITSKRFRPSLYRELKTALGLLDPLQLRRYGELRARPREAQATDPTAVLDAVLLDQKFRFLKALGRVGDQEKADQRAVLLARAQGAPRVFDWKSSDTPDTDPALGTGSTKVSLYGGHLGRTGDSAYAGIEIRPVYHDLMDQDDGYTRYSEIALARTDLRYELGPDAHFRVRQFDAGSVVSLSPIDSVSKIPSWAVLGGFYTPEDLPCHDCTAGRLNGGVGVSTYLHRKPENGLVFALLKGGAEWSGHFTDAWRVGPSWLAGGYVNWGASAKLGAQGEIYYYWNQPAATRSPKALRFEASYTPPKFGGRIELRWSSVAHLTAQENYWDHQARLGWYF